MKFAHAVIVSIGLLPLQFGFGNSALAFKNTDFAPVKPNSVHHIQDATPMPEPYSQYGNPETYAVAGTVYKVLKDNKDFVQRGVASWYGLKFHGKRTSSGEVYDIYGMTAAHKTLPIPTYAEVTNLDNGKSVRVKINDRGPFIGDRIIDLSYAAAKKLDIVANGTGRVEVRTISFEHDTEFTPSQNHFLQLGAFKNFDNAWALRQKVKHIGQNLIHIQISKNESNKLYHVKVGPVRSQAQHSAIIQQLTQLGLPDLSHVLSQT